MSVLSISKYFDKNVNQQSPVQKDYSRVVNYDSEGNEYITFVEFDYPSFQKSLGSVNDWSLDSLLAAGINPDFPIHTGVGTRLEGVSSIADWNAAADTILEENINDNKE